MTLTTIPAAVANGSAEIPSHLSENNTAVNAPVPITPRRGEMPPAEGTPWRAGERPLPRPPIAEVPVIDFFEGGVIPAGAAEDDPGSTILRAESKYAMPDIKNMRPPTPFRDIVVEKREIEREAEVDRPILDTTLDSTTIDEADLPPRAISIAPRGRRSTI